jgi:O-antigen/teichoic acid export membrane protein
VVVNFIASAKAILSNNANALSLASTKVITLITGLITTFLIVKNLSDSVQGIYYLFLSLISLQVFAEMGLNYALIQIVSHEKIHLKWVNGVLNGDEDAKKRLIQIFKYAMRWYAYGSSIFIILMIPGGMLFISNKNLFDFHLTIIWTVLIVSTGAAFFLNAIFSILEGCNKIKSIALIRSTQQIIYSIVLWLGFGSGLQLYSMAIANLALVSVGCFLVYISFKKFIIEMFRVKLKFYDQSIMHEIKKYQRKLSFSWISGYLAYQAVIPIVFHSLGAISAGKFGMSMQIMSAINGLTIVWISAVAPKMGGLIAKHNYGDLNSVFYKNLRKSTISLFTTIVIAIFIYKLDISLVNLFRSRLVNQGMLLLMIIAMILNHYTFAFAAYMRAFKKEPLLYVSILAGVLTVFINIILLPYFRLWGAIYSYLLVSIISFILTIMVFKRFKNAV